MSHIASHLTPEEEMFAYILAEQVKDIIVTSTYTTNWFGSRLAKKYSSQDQFQVIVSTENGAPFFAIRWFDRTGYERTKAKSLYKESTKGDALNQYQFIHEERYMDINDPLYFQKIKERIEQIKDSQYPYSVS